MTKNYDKLYVDGQWQVTCSTAFSEVINPATETVCGRIPRGNGQDVDRAVTAARRAFTEWSQTPAQERRRYIDAIAAKLGERQVEIADTIRVEQGAPQQFAMEVQATLPAAVMATYAERAALMDATEEVGNSLIVKQPIGVCALITPWNYPLHQIVGKVAPALAAGCTMVVKPSEETPLNAFLLAEIVDEVGLPAGVFNLVTGAGRVVGEALCTHPQVDMISFTGSTGVGQRISEMGGRTIKRVCLELGGKSANIILDDADLEAAIRYNVDQVMANSGQTCIALTRTLIPVARYEEAVQIAQSAADAIKVGDPADSATFMGPMVSAAQRDSVLDYIRKGIREGATLVAGGLEPPQGLETGYYVRPTVFADVNNAMVIAREEIFGPVMCLIPYRDETEAVAIANDSPFGLSGAVWSADTGRAIQVARRMQTGQVYINGGPFNPVAPIGGYKQSGNGRELGDEGLKEFIEIKAIQLNPAG